MRKIKIIAKVFDQEHTQQLVQFLTGNIPIAITLVVFPGILFFASAHLKGKAQNWELKQCNNTTNGMATL